MYLLNPRMNQTKYDMFLVGQAKQMPEGGEAEAVLTLMLYFSFPAVVSTL